MFHYILRISDCTELLYIETDQNNSEESSSRTTDVDVLCLECTRLFDIETDFNNSEESSSSTTTDETSSDSEKKDTEINVLYRPDTHSEDSNSRTI